MDVIEQNRLRTEIQNKCVELGRDNTKVLLQLATGVGKSLAALKIIDDIAFGLTSDKSKWHIVVWESKHIQNWLDDIKKHNMEHLLPYIEIYCYASLKTKAEVGVHYVCDEAHHMFAEKYWAYLTNAITPYTRVIALTATMPAEKLKLLKQTYPKLVKYGVTLTEAINMGLLPRPNIYVVPIGFNASEYTHTITIEKGAKAAKDKMPWIDCKYGQHWQYLKGAKVVKLRISCTAAQKLEYLNNQVDYQQTLYIKNRQEFQKIRWMAAGRDRKTFIAEAKTPAAKRLDIELNKLNARKITFCGSVDQAIELGQPENTIHSRITSKQSQAIVDNFNALQFNNLYTNRMVREGMNLNGIQFAVIVQLDKESLAFIQMLGRALRANNPHVFLLIARGTQDDKYFDSATLGIDTSLFKPVTEFFTHLRATP